MNDGRGHLAFLKRICNDNRFLCYKAFAVNPNVPALLLTPCAHSQKEGLGLDKCIETAKARMARYQVTPNMLVVPPEASCQSRLWARRCSCHSDVLTGPSPAPQLLLYIATSSEEKYVYNVAGPAGPAKFEAGVAGYEARSFRGCGVVTSTPFEISDDADSLQMLQRNTQVGEFYRMAPPAVFGNEPLPPTYMGARRPAMSTHSRRRTTLLCSHHDPFVGRHHDLRRGERPPRHHPVCQGAHDVWL